MKEKLQRPHANKLCFPETGEVDAIDFSQWVKNNFEEGDNITLKMDIEGSEYKVLPKMISDNTLKYINHLIIEWHDWVMPEFKDKTKELQTEIARTGIQVTNWG
jgi:hypothetical protein